MKKFFAEIEDNFCGLLLFVMAILTCINVFARYILHSSMPFVEELTCVGLVIISVGGAATAAKRGAIDIIYRYDAEEGSDCLSDRW